MNTRRTTAKALHRVAGQLARIKTWQRTYQMTWDSPDVEPVHRPTGRVWLPCGLAFRVMGIAMNLDWDHWDHWAARHDEHCLNPRPCPECGGTACDARPPEEAA